MAAEFEGTTICCACNGGGCTLDCIKHIALVACGGENPETGAIKTECAGAANSWCQRADKSQEYSEKVAEHDADSCCDKNRHYHAHGATPENCGASGEGSCQDDCCSEIRNPDCDEESCEDICCADVEEISRDNCCDAEIEDACGQKESCEENCWIGNSIVDSWDGECKDTTQDNCCDIDVGHSGYSKENADDISLKLRLGYDGGITVNIDSFNSSFRKYQDRYISFIDQKRCICEDFFKNLDYCCQRFAGTGDKQCRNIIPRKRSCRKSRLKKKDRAPVEVLEHDEVEIVSLLEKPTLVDTNLDVDIEKLDSIEHVTVKVTGMTCTGCSKKIERVLDGTTGVSNVNVAFVTGTAEFDIDKTRIDTKEFWRRIEKATGFKLSQIERHRATLTVESLSDFSGVCDLDIEKISKSRYRITYDHTVIGARDLLKKLPTAHVVFDDENTSLFKERRRACEMFFATFLCTLFTIPVLVLAWGDLKISYETKAVTSLVLASVVQAIAIPEFYNKALKALVFAHMLEMDMLIVIAITAAYGYSVIACGLRLAGYKLETDEFFETSTLLITLVFLGRLLTSVAKHKAISTISVRSLQEKTVFLTTGEEIDSRLLQYGDAFIVKPHFRVATDGEVLEGKSEIDESMISGESIPVFKQEGDTVLAGTLNGSGTLIVKLSKLPSQNVITEIADLVESAVQGKYQYQEVADKISGYFIPVILTVSFIVFVVWLIVNLVSKNKDVGGAIGSAISYAIAVLAISCPCALGLSVPMVVIIAGSVGAKRNIIIKEPKAIENAFRIKEAVFDKTGTLTKGKMKVTDFVQLSDKISLAKKLTENNTHPTSVAINGLNYIDSSDFDIDNIKSIPGCGIKGAFESQTLMLGNPKWVGVEDDSKVKTFLSRGGSVTCLKLGSKLIAIFFLEDELRDESITLIRELQNRNIRCHILSGDNMKSVEKIATQLGVDSYFYEQKPVEKQRFIASLEIEHRVLFCGDGTNDAGAIAQATVGLQIGDSSDISRATADTVLLGGLDGVVTLLDLSKCSYQRIILNFAWSGIYNTIAILFASGAFVRVRITPAYAGLGEIISVLPVVIIALSLIWTNRG